MEKKEIDTLNWRHRYPRGPELSDELRAKVKSALYPPESKKANSKKRKTS